MLIYYPTLEDLILPVIQKMRNYTILKFRKNYI